MVDRVSAGGGRGEEAITGELEKNNIEVCALLTDRILLPRKLWL